MLIESNTGKNNTIAILVLGLGILFLLLTAKIENPDRNQKAAYLLGILLSSVGGIALLTQDKRKVFIQPNDRQVFYTHRSTFSQEIVRAIHFDEINLVGVSRIGRNGPTRTPAYFVYVQLRSGELIKTGYFTYFEAEANELAIQAAQMIGCATSPIPIPPVDSEIFENIFLSVVIAAAIWAIYYRVKIGPWCPAMWFGTAPAFFILLDAWGTYYLLLTLRRKYRSK